MRLQDYYFRETSLTQYLFKDSRVLRRVYQYFQ